MSYSSNIFSESSQQGYNSNPHFINHLNHDLQLGLMTHSQNPSMVFIDGSNMPHHHHLLNTHGSSFNNVASHNLLQIEKLNTFVTNIVPNSKENELDQHILKENIESENKLTKLKVKRFTDVATHRINNTSEKTRKKRTIPIKKLKIVLVK